MKQLKLFCAPLVVLLILADGLFSSQAFAMDERQTGTTFVPDIEVLPQRGMWSERPAKRWQEAIITGDGTLGAMVFGEPAAEKIVLNHERLYEPLSDQPFPVPNIAHALPESRRLYREGNYKAGYLRFYNAAVESGFPGIQWTDPYHPACALEIDQSDSKEFSDYWRSTDFETGVTAVNWKLGEQSFKRETFASRPDGIIVIRIGSSAEAPIQGTVRLVNQDSRDKNMRTDEFGGGGDDPVVAARDGWLTYRCKYAKSKRGYQVTVRIMSDGKPATNSDKDSVSFHSNETIILVDIQSLENFADSDARMEAAKQRLNLIVPDFDSLLQRHSNVHSAMMNRVRFD